MGRPPDPAKERIPPGKSKPLRASLSRLSIGSLALNPAFDADTTSYTATTGNNTNTITAVAQDSDAAIFIAVNGETVNNGTAATWDDGENIVLITVKNGNAEQSYTVKVTKQ